MNHPVQSAEISAASSLRAVLIQNDAQAVAAAHRLALEFAPGASKRDTERLLPRHEIEQFSASGLGGIAVPREYGGAGVSHATLAAVIAIISAADPSLGQIPQNHFFMLDVLRVNGTEAQKKFFFARALAGDRFGNALSETGTKTVADYKTTLTRDLDGVGYRINGRKFYSTGALFATWIPVVVRSEDSKLQVAFIKSDVAGLSLIDDWSGFGQRTTGSGSSILDNVYVDASAVVPYSAAFDHPTTVGPLGQLIHAAVDLGIAQAALQDTLSFVKNRSRPWIDSGVEHAANDPLTLRDIGDISIRLHAAQALVERAGQILDATAARPDAQTVARASLAVAEARVLTTEIALQATTKLFELAGTQATLAEHNLDRHWRNARTHTLHDPVRWKYIAVGDFYLNGTLPPRHGAL